MAYRIAVAGDALITRHISEIKDPRAVSIFEVLQTSDLAFLNCETLFHDYHGPEVYPSAEAGWAHMRSPPEVAKDLAWLGVKLAALANNHALDYSYGGLFSTLAAMKAAGISVAGAGRDLAEARAPAYVDTPEARIALISMTSSSTRASRAGNSHDGVPGRPGVNPLSYHFAADDATLAQAIDLARKCGMWVAQVGDHQWEINPPGLHLTVTRYVRSDAPGVRMLADEEDLAANLRSIKEAKANADIVIVHVHNHEWDTATNALNIPPEFIRDFARSAIRAGGDIIVAQGCHSPVRGIEFYDGKPIFYDTGDIFLMAGHVTRFPSDFYQRHSPTAAPPAPEALPHDAFAAMFSYMKPMHPTGGYYLDGPACGVVPVMEYEGGRLTRLELHPFVHEQPNALLTGVPLRPDAAGADRVIALMTRLSSPLGTSIRKDGDSYLVAGSMR